LSIPRDIAFGVWKRLPPAIRRPVGRLVLERAAPPLAPADPLSLADSSPRIVVGFLTSPSGLGESARLAHAALVAQGRDVYGIDLSARFGEEAGRIAFPFRDGAGLSGPAKALIVINAPYMGYAHRLLGPAFLAGKHLTGYWAVELPDLPEAWRKGFDCCHAVAAPSRFVADALERLNPKFPVAVLPHPVACMRSPELPPKVGGEFTVVSAANIASGFARKHPVGLINAFRLAFGDDPEKRLRLLLSNVSHYPEAKDAVRAAVGAAPNIDVLYDTLDRAAYWRWFGAPDLVASLHRSEGFGLLLAEAMVRGIPVLSTDWSATSEFIDDSVGYPVPARLIPVADAQGKYPDGSSRWADPDIEVAARQLRRACSDAEDRLARGRNARLQAEALFGSFAF
jgi:glycosyltransferase involved in cell wall biosynthesis